LVRKPDPRAQGREAPPVSETFPSDSRSCEDNSKSVPLNFRDSYTSSLRRHKRVIHFASLDACFGDTAGHYHHPLGEALRDGARSRWPSRTPPTDHGLTPHGLLARLAARGRPRRRSPLVVTPGCPAWS